MDNNNFKIKAVNGALWGVVDKFFSQVVTFFVIIYLARELEPSDFGLVGMLAIFVSISEIFISAGFSSALIQKQNRTENDFSTVFYTNITVALILYLILFFSAPVISDFYNSPELVDISRVLFFSLVINALYIVPDTKLTIDFKFKLKSKINIASLFISSLAAIFCASSGYGVWSLVIQTITRSIIILCLHVLLFRWTPTLVFSQVSFKQLFGFGSKLLIAGFISKLVNNLYGLLIGRYFSANDVGYYMYGQRITGIVSNTISNVAQSVTFPVMTAVQHDKDRLVLIYSKVLRIIIFVTFPVMIGLALVAEPFVLIFLTEKWLPAVPIIQWLCIATLFLPINVLNINLLNATGRSDLFLKVDLIKFPINLIILILAIPYGIDMVVTGKALVMFISFFINSYYPGKLYNYGFFVQVKTMLPIIATTSIMAFFVYFIELQNQKIELFLSIFFGVLIYMFFSHLFKIEAYNDLRQILKEKVRKNNGK